MVHIWPLGMKNDNIKLPLYYKEPNGVDIEGRKKSQKHYDSFNYQDAN